MKSGEYKDMGSPVREMTPEERKILQNFVDKIHHQFVRDVSLGRDMDPEKTSLLADGRIFTGEEAKELGLVDRLGNLEDAVDWAGELGGIEGEVPRVYPKQKKMSFLEYLTEASIKQVMDRMVHSQIKGGYMYVPSS